MSPLPDSLSWRPAVSLVFGEGGIDTLLDFRARCFTRHAYADGREDQLNQETSRHRDSHFFDRSGLVLPAHLVSETQWAFESAMLRLREPITPPYFVSIRCKVPRARGLKLAGWIYPADKTWPPEADIFEIVNGPNDDSRRSFHILKPKEGGALPPAGLLDKWHAYRPGFDYADRFTDFGYLDTGTACAHFVDRVQVRDAAWNIGAPGFLCVEIATGGTWAGNPVSGDDFPAHLVVRSIEVWKPGA